MLDPTGYLAEQPKLTQQMVKDLPAPSKGSVTVWDSEITGFGVRIFAPTRRRPRGARSFFLNYRHEGFERRFTIGRFPDWTVEAARAEARELRRRVDRGEDPASARRERREAPTMLELGERFRQEVLPRRYASYRYCAQPERETLAKEGKSHLDNLPRRLKARAGDDERKIEEVVELLGPRTKVVDITSADIERMHRTISESIGKRGKPRIVRANRILVEASKAFSLTLKVAEGELRPWRDQAMGNPCKGIEKNPEEGKERFFSELEISLITDALSEYPPSAAADCIRVIMLTGCRPDEAMSCRWEQLDTEPGFWIKPRGRTKDRRTHKQPLSGPALELFAQLRSKREAAVKAGEKVGPWVFPGRDPDQCIAQIHSCWHWVRARATVHFWHQCCDNSVVRTMVSDLAARLGRIPTFEQCHHAAHSLGVELPEGLSNTRAYDLRHTFASIGASSGVSQLIVGKLLGHARARSTERYTHLFDEAGRAAAQAIGKNILRFSRSGGRAKVLPFKK
jgi:integrase